jgi:hypothetical protein
MTTSLSLPITQPMIDAVAGYIAQRAVEETAFPQRDIIITTEEIADHFGLKMDYAEAIHRAVYRNPPELLKRSCASLVWDGVGEYYNPNY